MKKTQAQEFPVSAHARSIEKEWAPLLAAHFDVAPADFLASPTRYMAFRPQTVTVELMDDSVVSFRWAFALVDVQRRAIAVFTEHCGHHLFPLHDARVLIDGVVLHQDAACR